VNPLDCDIVPEVDIAAHERPQLNKCLSKSARTAAFNLLLILCKMNPTLGNDIIQTYLYPIIYQRVKRPKKSGFNPSLDNRINGYCGLKNLGCICYMNSMVQQFFNIPTFRYSMLALREN
jgi:ubiquitin C-terminal hydrolase